MKKFFLSVFVLLFITSVYAFSETSLTVTFINNTGYTVKELYISPTSHDDWHDNLLKGSVVPNGETMEITIPEYSKDDFIYDLMAVDTQGDSYSKYEIDFSNSSNRQIELTFDDYEDNPDSDGVVNAPESSSDNYTSGYRDGYSAGYKDAYGEAYKDGYKAGLEESRAKDGEGH